MPPEFWLVLTVAAAFLLLGIAASPLAWVALTGRRSRSEQCIERQLRELAWRVRALETGLVDADSSEPVEAGAQRFVGTGSPHGRGPSRTNHPGARASSRADGTAGSIHPKLRTMASSPVGAIEPALIAVPNLETAVANRDDTISGLKERYAAIWALSDKGAVPEMIARATGQPIGQIELILGLRRQIDGARPTIPHAPRA
jgi:hypothetical protein